MVSKKQAPKLEDCLSYFEYVEILNGARDLERDARNGEVNKKEYCKREKAAIQKLCKYPNVECFKTEGELEERLKKEFKSHPQVAESVEHEASHAGVAREYGMEYQFLMVLFYSPSSYPKPMAFHLFVRSYHNGKGKNRRWTKFQDLKYSIESAKAPRNLSLYDQEKLVELRQDIENSPQLGRRQKERLLRLIPG